MDYEYKLYNNFQELKADDLELAKKLEEQFGDGEWKNNEICVYPDDWEYAKYELTDGWYMNCNFRDNYNDAPNPFDYIDMQKFADALTSTWDASMNVMVGEKVVTTAIGF